MNRSRRWKGALVAVAVGAGALQGAPADAAIDTPVVHFVIDVSGSMAGDPLDQAKAAVVGAVDGLPDTTAVGLRSYAGSCDQGGVPPVVPIAVDNDAALVDGVNSLQAGGGTPTTSGLAEGIDDLRSFETSGTRRLVLLTDGDTACGISICDWIRTQDLSGLELQLFAVGLGVSTAAAADLACAAEYTGGAYLSATSPEDLLAAIAEAAGGAERWFSVSSPIAGTRIGAGRRATTALPAAVFRRSFGIDSRFVTGELVTQTLNLAGGLGSSDQNKNNAKEQCGSTLSYLWICRADDVAKVVVDDLRRTVPANGAADPVVVLMVQEARPVMVDAIAEEMAARFGRRVETLYVDATEPDAEARNTTAKACGDGSENREKYRCEYGNALISTSRLTPLSAINFNRDRPGGENRAFLSASVDVGRPVTVGTVHMQCDDCERGNPDWRSDRELLQRLTPFLPDPVIIGGDFNRETFSLDGFQKVSGDRGTGVCRGWGIFRSCGRKIDYFVTRPVIGQPDLGTTRTRNLTVSGYTLDHARVAVRWSF